MGEYAYNGNQTPGSFGYSADPTLGFGVANVANLCVPSTTNITGAIAGAFADLNNAWTNGELGDRTLAQGYKRIILFVTDAQNAVAANLGCINKGMINAPAGSAAAAC